LERAAPPPPATPPPGGEPPEPHDEDVPASVAQLRTLRRWLVVTGVWAVAASAIAIIALLEANDEPDRQSGVTGAQLNRVQQNLDERLEELEQRPADLPQRNDLSRLQNRLQEVENSSSGTSDDIRRLNGEIDDLEQRIQRAEQQQDTQTETTP
jgi:peptidoglycan hydrolase CwlO-like protein